MLRPSCRILTLACVQGYMNLLDFFAVYGTLCKETGTPFRQDTFVCIVAFKYPSQPGIMLKRSLVPAKEALPAMQHAAYVIRVGCHQECQKTVEMKKLPDKYKSTCHFYILVLPASGFSACSHRDKPCRKL